MGYTGSVYDSKFQPKQQKQQQQLLPRLRIIKYLARKRRRKQKAAGPSLEAREAEVGSDLQSPF